MHGCAVVALAYAARAATFASSWIELPLLQRRPAGALPSLSIVVPARDEERSIERCVRSLLAQEWLDFEVIVVDDRSTDATPHILARLAGEDSRLRVIAGGDLPAGWVGKPWALAQGERHARGDWLLFTDADSRHHSRGAVSALWFATLTGVDALSIATGQELGTFWERAAVPSILGTILFVSGTLGAINDPAQRSALANGQYIMVSRAAYEALGGHTALRAEIVEDVAFARRVKADGRYRYILAGGAALASVRMYHSLGEIWSGFTKNVYLGAAGDLRALFAGMLFLGTISLAPPALAIRALAARRYGTACEAAACTVAIVASASWGMRTAGFARRLALLQPLGSALFAAIVVNSTLQALTGRGVRWRGRRYDPFAVHRLAQHGDDLPNVLVDGETPGTA